MIEFLVGWFVWMLGWGVFMLGVVVTTLVLFQRRLIYVPALPDAPRSSIPSPSSFGFGDWAHLSGPLRVRLASATSDLTLAFQDMSLASKVTFRTEDGLKLSAFWLRYVTPAQIRASPAFDDESAFDRHVMQDDQRPVLLYCHANAGNMGHRLPLARYLMQVLQCHVFLFSYRGYADSEGSPTQAGLECDAKAALANVLERSSHTGGVKRRPLIVYGQSIGCAVALSLARQSPDLIDGVLLENPFLSLPKLLPSVMPIFAKFGFFVWDTWTNDAWLTELVDKQRHSEQDAAASGSKRKLPILILTGQKDTLIPPSHSVGLFHILCARPDLLAAPLHALPRDVRGGQSVVLPSKLDAYQAGPDHPEWQLTFLPKGSHNDTCLQPHYYAVIQHFVRTHILAPTN